MAQRYAKTDIGQEVIKTRSVALSPRQRTLLLLCDGKREQAQLLQETAGLGVTAQDLADLLARGLIALIAEDAPYSPFSRPDTSPDPAAVTAPFVAPPPAPMAAPATAPAGPEEDPALTPAERYRQAYPIATRLTAALGLRGMRLQLEVERCSTTEELRALFPRLLDAAANNPKAKQELQPLRAILGMH